MIIDIVKGISVPFLGTTLGAFCVFFLKNELSKGMQKALTGFAAGVMVAASIWSLLLPAGGFAWYVEVPSSSNWFLDWNFIFNGNRLFCTTRMY